MRIIATVLIGLCGLLLVGALALWAFGAELYDRAMNRVAPDPTAPVPTQAERALHRSMFITDLHADTLKWDRDMLERATWGHLDLPRLVDGNVALQVFTVVTRSAIPRPAPNDPDRHCVSAGGPNMAAVLAAFQGRPVFSQRDRALYQARLFQETAERSRQGGGPELRPIYDIDDLRGLVADRRAGKPVIGGILGIEGGHWIGRADLGEESIAADMREMFDAGVRLFAPTHRFDNSLGGAGEGCESGGLTPQGRQALREAERLGMVVDLAHISPQGLRDASATVARPFVVSHTGIQAGCEPPCRPARNLSDEDITIVLRHGGLIGIGYWPQAVGPSVWRVADAMAHVMGIAGSMGLEPGRHVALGSDYDGSVTPFFDAGDLDVLTAVMLRRPEPFPEEVVRDVAGRNACRLFATLLPGGGPQAAEEVCRGL